MIKNSLIGVQDNNISELNGDELLKDYDEIWIYRNYRKYICRRAGYIVDMRHMTYSVIMYDIESNKKHKYFVHYSVLSYLNNSTYDFYHYVIHER